MKTLIVLARVIARASILVAGIALAAILVLVSMQIGTRVFTGDSLTWSDELARLCFVFLVFIGAAEASARHAHIAISLKDTFGLSERIDRYLDIIRLAACIGLLGIIAWGTWQIIPVVQNMKLPATRLSTALLYIPVLIGSVAMIAATALNLIAAILDRELLGKPSGLGDVE